MSKQISRRSFIALSGGLVILAACGSNDEPPPPATTSVPGQQAAPEAVTLRLGYFPNLTHTQPQVGIQRGNWGEILGSHVTLDTSKTFNAGPSAIEAMFAGEIDATYIGPNPAINGYIKSEGEEVRIVAGATSGGALLVVRSDAGISSAADFADRRVATPQLGNTQDVAFRAWLIANGLGAKESGGNVEVLPIANADQLTLFQQGEIDAAWSPEPWATRLIQEAGGEVFLDERDLWPGGEFVTTHLIVRPSFLEDHPDVVESLIRAHVETTEWINANPAEARALVNKNIEAVTTKALPEAVLDAAWENLTITYDPVASSLAKSAADAFELGFLGNDEPDLSGIYALDLLNKVLQEKRLLTVEGI
jgi:NitT/TauT family transport system substrate-binding protein